MTLSDTPGVQDARPPVGQTPARPSDTELVGTGQAARLAGVDARTVRRWIERGYLPALAGPHGSLVSPDDLDAARVKAQRAGGHGGAPGHPDARPTGGHPDRAPDPNIVASDNTPDRGTDTHPAQVSASARSQLEAIRDEWLAPLIAEIREQAEEIGRLRERHEAAELRAVEAAAAAITAQAAAVEQRRIREVEAGQADQLVNLLEDQVQELRRRLIEATVMTPAKEDG